MSNIDAKVLEVEIIACARDGDVDRIRSIESTLRSELAKLGYFMSRFIEKYGSKLDEKADDNYNRFYNDKTRDYASMTRLLRIISAYGN